ncbi:MAG: gamma-glutamyltransferase [Bacteroidota bacterium]
MNSPKYGIIAAGHRETAKAGMAMLEAGGNAFDAALAAVFASFIAEPSLTSLGGGGFMTAVPAQGQPCLYDFFVQTPLVKRPIEELEFVESQINFGTTVQLQYIGKGSVAVPGCPAGLFAAHADLGSMPITEIAEPAIQLARQGVEITPYQAYTISILEPVVLFSKASAEIYGIDGRLVGEGERLRNPKLADSIAYLCKEGVREFYEGEMGQAFARDNAHHGGSVSLEDLQAFSVIKRDPLAYQYRDHLFLTNPPPSAGGSMISFGLALLSQSENVPPNDMARIRHLAGTMRGMEEFRSAHLQAKLAEGFDPSAFLTDAFVAQEKRQIDWLGNTTHISVIDTKGNAVSVTTTLGGASGQTIPGTGIVTNNMLGETDLHPGGPYGWEPNQRVRSMMSPSVVLRDGKPAMVTGSGGSSRIRSAILQVLSNLIDQGMSVEEAVRHPRLHWENHILNLEPGLVESNQSIDLAGTETIRWADRNMFFGGVHTVRQTADGRLEGFADARRDGFCLCR